MMRARTLFYLFLYLLVLTVIPCFLKEFIKDVLSLWKCSGSSTII